MRGFSSRRTKRGGSQNSSGQGQIPEEQPASATMERPGQWDVIRWSPGTTQAVHRDLGLTAGRSLREWKIEILKYFKHPFRKRPLAFLGEGGSPSAVHTTASRRTGQTPEAVRQLPMPGGGPSVERMTEEAGIGGLEGNGGEDETGGAPAAQRRFTRSMARAAAEGSQKVQDSEAKQQAQEQPEGGLIWTIPPPVQIQTAGGVPAPAMHGRPATVSKNPPPSLPRTPPPPAPATIPNPEETDRPPTLQTNPPSGSAAKGPDAKAPKRPNSAGSLMTSARPTERRPSPTRQR